MMPGSPRPEDTQTSITYPADLERRLLRLLAELKQRRLIRQGATRNQLVLALIDRVVDQLLTALAAGAQVERIDV